MKYLNRTSLAWRSKLKGNSKTRWDEVSGIYIQEVRVQKIYLENIGGVKEDKGIYAARDFIRRAMQCTWWGWEEGSCCFCLRRPREFSYAIIYEKKVASRNVAKGFPAAERRKI